MLMFPIDRGLPFRNAADYCSERNSTPIAGNVNPPHHYLKRSRSSIRPIPEEKDDHLSPGQEHTQMTKKECSSCFSVNVTEYTYPSSSYSTAVTNGSQRAQTIENTSTGKADQVSSRHPPFKAKAVIVDTSKTSCSLRPNNLQWNDGVDVEPCAPTEDEDSVNSDILDDEIWFYGETHSSGNPETKPIYEAEGGPNTGTMTPEQDQTNTSRPDSGSNKRIKTKKCRDETVMFDASLKLAMIKSTKSQTSLQQWDRKNDLPASHCKTMVDSSRSREQLLSGKVLQKWNGVPLLILPGAPVKVTRRQFRGVIVAEIA